MQNIILYLIPALIWGSTWLAIKYQLGHVDPIVSVGYRFVFAAAILLAYCKLSGMNLKYDLRQHRAIALQGLLLNGLNYWLVYMAELQLPSGIVAIVFSSFVFFNIFNSAIFLKMPIQRKMILGALIGIIGILLVFQNELQNFEFQKAGFMAIAFCILSVAITSLGDMVSYRNQRLDLPVIQSAGFCMLYGGGIMLGVSLLLGKPFVFDSSVEYVGSLLYLSLFGSVVAFTCYLALVRRIGPGKSGYITLIFPIIALLLSTFFESYTWTATNLLGVSLIMIGNLVNMRKPAEVTAKVD